MSKHSRVFESIIDHKYTFNHCTLLNCLLLIQARATKKPPTTSKRAKALSVNKQNASIRRYDRSFSLFAAYLHLSHVQLPDSIMLTCLPEFRSTRKPLVTPARSMLDCSMMGATPLVTPRFDPRLANIIRLKLHHFCYSHCLRKNGCLIRCKLGKDLWCSLPFRLIQFWSQNEFWQCTFLQTTDMKRTFFLH